MTDKQLNETFARRFAAIMGNRPGQFHADRENSVEKDCDDYSLIHDDLERAYPADSVLRTKTARMTSEGMEAVSNAFSDLAERMRCLGYGIEAYRFATISNVLSQSDPKRFVANLGCEAYAKGLILGNYEMGLGLYQDVDRKLRENGDTNEVALIKMQQNKGQIYHRMGAKSPVYYDLAEESFIQGIAALHDSCTLNDARKSLFFGQIRQCYAKTLIHMARREPHDASVLLDRAHVLLDLAMDDMRPLDGREFEKACLMAVRGSLHAAAGMRENAHNDFGVALEVQKVFGPTLAPRIASTMIKLADVSEPDEAAALRSQANSLLKGFYGPKGHPDLKVYENHIRRSRKDGRRQNTNAVS